jgi:hypothetical protein
MCSLILAVGLIVAIPLIEDRWAQKRASSVSRHIDMPFAIA